MKAIYCAGEQGRVVLDILRRSGPMSEIGLFDDDDSLYGHVVGGLEVVGGMEALEAADSGDLRVVVAHGRPTVRLDIADRLAERAFDFFSAVDTDATVSESATIGTGVMMNAQTYVGPDVVVGDLALVDSGANLSHDVRLGRGATICPNVTLAGGVEVGEAAYIGAGATVIDHVEVGEGAVVGAGSVVTGDVPPETTVVGVPATPSLEGD